MRVLSKSSAVSFLVISSFCTKKYERAAGLLAQPPNDNSPLSRADDVRGESRADSTDVYLDAALSRATVRSTFLTFIGERVARARMFARVRAYAPTPRIIYAAIKRPTSRVQARGSLSLSLFKFQVIRRS